MENQSRADLDDRGFCTFGCDRYIGAAATLGFSVEAHTAIPNDKAHFTSLSPT